MDILQEKDGPMLLHGLQGFQGKTILRPSSRALWARVDFLAERYEEFRQAS
jgi:putative restriction endonuclease